MKVLAALFALFALTAARDPILVPEVSQHEIRVRQGFTGAELLLYGAILDPAGTRAGREYDIVVVLKGPAQAVRMREKKRRLGIWVNADTTAFRSAPSFFAVASTRPVDTIVDAKTAAIFELGLAYIQLSPIGAIDPVEQTTFAQGLVDQRMRAGLYSEQPAGVSVSEQVLYQAHIALPSQVQTGIYTAETFAIRNGRVIASATADIEVRKVGFERLVADWSRGHSVAYGLIAVLLSVGMGWVAGRLSTLF